MDLQEYYSRFIVILSDTPERGWLHDTNWLKQNGQESKQEEFLGPYAICNCV